MNNAGIALYNGEGVAEDPAEALIYFLAAGKNGNYVGDFRAGMILLHGAEGVDQDLEHALACLKRAARAGHQGAEQKVNELAPEAGVHA